MRRAKLSDDSRMIFLNPVAQQELTMSTETMRDAWVTPQALGGPNVLSTIKSASCNSVEDFLKN